MKTVSKLFTAAVVLFTAIACQSIDEGKIETNQLEVSATIVGSDDTKVDYDVTNDKDHNVYSISPEWTVDDEIIGFDNLGHTFTFTAAGVSPNGKNATFTLGDYKLESGVYKLYAIYAPGYSTENFKGDEEGKYLEIDLSSQGGVLNGEAPVLMCATAEVNGDKVNFSFANQTAIIGVNRFQLYGATVNKVNSMTLKGVVTEGKFEIGNKGNLVLNPTGLATSITATNGVTGWALENGICEAGVYFAAIPSTNATLSLEAFAGEKTYKKVDFVTGQTLEAGKYYHTARVLASFPVAKVTIDGVETEYYTIAEAFAAADCSNKDCTITLLENCSTSEQLLIDDGNNGAVTLDLNGKTLNCSTSNAYINVLNNRDFTITDNSDKNVAKQGTIKTSEANYVVRNYGGSLTIAGGNIRSTRNYYAIYTSGTATISGGKIYSTHTGVYVESGSLIISGGEIESTKQCVSNSGTTNISGGTFTSTSTEIAQSTGSSATINVTGGYFSSESTSVELFTIASSGNCYVTGGYFDRAVSSTFTKTSNGYARSHILNTTAATRDDYPFKVGSWQGGYPFVVKIGTSSTTYWHNNLPSAARQARNAQNDVEISLRVNTEKNQSKSDLTNNNGNAITLDLNGKTLSTDASRFITTSGELTIKDGTRTGVKISSSDNVVVWLTANNVNVSIEDCEITTSASGTNFQRPIIDMISNKGNLEIRNSKIYSTGHYTVLRVYSGTTDIYTSELTSGKNDNGYYVMVASGSGTLNVHSGSFYTSGTDNSSSCHIASSNAHINILADDANNPCYFYSSGRTVSSGNSSYYQNTKICGGYFNQMPTPPSGGGEPKYITGYTMGLIQTQTYTPSTVGTPLTYDFGLVATN